MVGRAYGQVARLRTGAVCRVVQDGCQEVLEREGSVIEGGDPDVVSDERETKDCAAYTSARCAWTSIGGLTYTAKAVDTNSW